MQRSNNPTGRISIAACCGVFLLSCYVSVMGNTILTLVLALLSAALLVAGLLLRGRIHLAARALPVMCFMFAALVLSLSHRLLIELPAYSLVGNGVRINAVVRDIEYSDYSMSMLLELKRADGEKVRGKLHIELEGFVTLKELDSVELLADISLNPERNTSIFSGSPNRSRGVFLSGTLTEGIKTSDIKITPAYPSVSLTLKRLKGAIKDRLERYLWCKGDYPSAQASLACGILLGERDGISYAVRSDFNRTGISHILSVSGMHLSILIGSLFALLCALGVHRRAACVSVMAAALFYMSLCGFIPSATRAGVMALFYYTALFLGRDSDTVSSLFMAGTVICIINPYTVADISFMLSFLATLGIVTVSPYLSRMSSAAEKRSRLLVLPAALLSSLGITIAAVFFTLPVTCAVFGTLSVVSPAANIAAAPFVQFIMMLSPLVAALCFIPQLAGLLGLAVYACCDILSGIAHALSRPDWAVVALPYQGLSAVSALGALCTVLLPYSRKAWRAVLTLSLAACLIAGVGIFALGRAWDSSHMRLLYTAKGSGQQLILCGGESGADIIDMSDGSRTQLYAISRAMTESGDTAVSSLVLTCLHQSHPAFFEALAERLPVKTLYLPVTQCSKHDMTIKAKLDMLASEAGCDIIYYTSDIALNSASLYLSTISVRGSVQTMAEVSTEDMRVLYLTKGQPYTFSHELEGEYDGVILGTHASSLDGQDFLQLVPKHFALYTNYNYMGVSLAPRISPVLLRHLTDNNLLLYNATGALFTRMMREGEDINIDMTYEGKTG